MARLEKKVMKDLTVWEVLAIDCPYEKGQTQSWRQFPDQKHLEKGHFAVEESQIVIA